MLQLIVSFSLRQNSIDRFCRHAADVLTSPFVLKHVVAAVLVGLQSEGALFYQSARHCEFPLQAGNPGLSLCFLDHSESEVSHQGVSSEHAIVSSLRPFRVFLLESGKHFLQGIHGEDVVDAGEVQSRQLQSVDAERLHESVFGEIVEWSLQSLEVVVVDGVVGGHGEAVVGIGGIEVVRSRSQVLVHCKFQIQVPRGLREDLSLPELHLLSKHLLVFLHLHPLLPLQQTLVVVRVPRLLSEVKIGLLQALADVAARCAWRNGTADVAKLRHFFEVELVASEGEVEAHFHGQSGEAVRASQKRSHAASSVVELHEAAAPVSQRHCEHAQQVRACSLGASLHLREDGLVGRCDEHCESAELVEVVRVFCEALVVEPVAEDALLALEPDVLDGVVEVVAH